MGARVDRTSLSCSASKVQSVSSAIVRPTTVRWTCSSSTGTAPVARARSSQSSPTISRASSTARSQTSWSMPAHIDSGMRRGRSSQVPTAMMAMPMSQPGTPTSQPPASQSTMIPMPLQLPSRRMARRS